MATQFVNTDISGPGVRVTLADGDGVWVSRNGVVVSTTNDIAIYGSGSGHIVHIEGAVSGFYGVQLGDNATLDFGNAVVIARTGVVYGSVMAS